MFGLKARARMYREMEDRATRMLDNAERNLEYDVTKSFDILDHVESLFYEFGHPSLKFLVKYNFLLERRHQLFMSATTKIRDY